MQLCIGYSTNNNLLSEDDLTSTLLLFLNIRLYYPLRLSKPQLFNKMIIVKCPFKFCVIKNYSCKWLTLQRRIEILLKIKNVA